MKYFTSIICVLLGFGAFSQNYCDRPYAFLVLSGAQGYTDQTFIVDTATDHYGVEFPVKLRFTAPINDTLTFTKRPLVIGVHGGGYISDSLSNSATGAYGDMFNQVKGGFAPLGYLAASLDYRCGFGKDKENALITSLYAPGSEAECKGLDPLLMAGFDTAAYRAAADVRAAIHYVITHPDSFPDVDTSQIYLYGVSAGAISILHAAFSEKDDFFPGSNLPEFAPKHHIAGVWSQSGALVTDFGNALKTMEPGDSTALFIAQGTSDPIVPTDIGPLNHCSNILPQEWWTGGISLAQRACELDYNYELALVQGGGHDLGGSGAGGTIYGEVVRFMKNTGMCRQKSFGKELTVSVNDGSTQIARNCKTPPTNYCSNPTSFLINCVPLIVDTFLVNTDTAVDVYGNNFPVKLKFSRPIYDSLGYVKRPLIIGVHGGGFVSDSLAPLAATNAYLQEFQGLHDYYTPLGFVTASLDYRTGYGVYNEAVVSNALGNPNNPAACALMDAKVLKHLDTAVYRAVYDCRMAIDFICRNSELFPYIDTSKIFITGHSAGAITVLHTTYSEVNDIFQSSNSSLPPFAPRHKIAGVLSQAGVLTPNYSAALNDIQASEGVPTFLTHGTADLILPVDSGAAGTCSTVAPEDCFNGSIKIAERLCDQKIPYELFLIEGAGHDVGGGSAGFGLMANAFFRFIKDKGMCGDTSASRETTVTLGGVIVNQTTCVDHTGIFEKTQSDLSVKLFPNPLTTELNLEFSNGSIEDVEILDVTGRSIISIQNPVKTINTSLLNPGIYFIRISTNKGIVSSSFMKL